MAGNPNPPPLQQGGPGKIQKKLQKEEPRKFWFKKG